MDIKEAIKQGIKYSKYEKIETGIYDFIVKKVCLEKTIRSKRDCIVYYGEIKNKYGEFQETKLVDSIDNQENIKFAISRLIKFLRYFKVVTDSEIESCETIEQFLEFSKKTINKSIKINFIQKMVAGYLVKEKVFIYE